VDVMLIFAELRLEVKFMFIRFFYLDEVEIPVVAVQYSD
jgi:hypothetical protein